MQDVIHKENIAIRMCVILLDRIWRWFFSLWCQPGVHGISEHIRRKEISNSLKGRLTPPLPAMSRESPYNNRYLRDVHYECHRTEKWSRAQIELVLGSFSTASDYLHSMCLDRKQLCIKTAQGAALVGSRPVWEKLGRRVFLLIVYANSHYTF